MYVVVDIPWFVINPQAFCLSSLHYEVNVQILFVFRKVCVHVLSRMPFFYSWAQKQVQSEWDLNNMIAILIQHYLASICFTRCNSQRKWGEPEWTIEVAFTNRWTYSRDEF